MKVEFYRMERMVIVFKERLTLTGKTLFIEILMPFTACLLVVFAIIAGGIYLPKLFLFITAIVFVFIGIILLMGLAMFIHWLFIEPFKKNK